MPPKGQRLTALARQQLIPEDGVVEVYAMLRRAERLLVELHILPASMLTGVVPIAVGHSSSLIIDRLFVFSKFLTNKGVLPEYVPAHYSEYTNYIVYAVVVFVMSGVLLGEYKAYNFFHAFFTRIYPNGVLFPREINPVLMQIKNPAYMDDHFESVKQRLTSHVNALENRKKFFSPFSALILLFLSAYTISSIERSQKKRIDLSGFLINAFVHGLILTVIISCIVFIFSWGKSKYINWNRDQIVKEVVAELNKNFSVPSSDWRCKAAYVETGIVYVKFNEERVAIIVDGENIQLSADKYFSELAIVLSKAQLNFFVVMKNGLYLSLQDATKLIIQNIKEQLLTRLRRFAAQARERTKIISGLNFFNDLRSEGNNWQQMEEDDEWLAYCLFSHDIPEKFIAELKSFYPQLEIIKKPQGFTLLIRNPKPTNIAAPVYPVDESAQPRLRRTKFTSAVEQPRAAEVQPAAHIRIVFPMSQLEYDSGTYYETTARMWPMYADWLPDYCHFSYLDPELLTQLPDGLEPVAVLNLVRSGRTYPSGILEGAAGGVGIVQAEEAYTNIHGQVCVSHYKIKTSHHRLHGRLLEITADNRHRVYIFDGVRGHGH